jgi:hypothetical protein
VQSTLFNLTARPELDSGKYLPIRFVAVPPWIPPAFLVTEDIKGAISILVRAVTSPIPRDLKPTTGLNEPATTYAT